MTWASVNPCVATTAGIADAPSDGTFYGRRNGAWVNPSHSDITDWAAALAASLSSYAPLLSPALIGAPTGPTPAPGDNSTKLATTAFVTAAVVASTSGVASFNGRTGAVVQTSLDVTTALGFTPYNSTNPAGYQTAAQVSAAISAIGAPPAPSSTVPAMDGSPAVGTATTYARADHVHPSDTSRAPLASPAFSGTPTAPTATPGDNSTKLATTAYVGAAIGAIATPHVPTMQIFLTGTGTYTKPAGVTWLRARGVAAGAGGYGGGGPSAPSAPGAGGNTTFGPLTANGGGNWKLDQRHRRRWRHSVDRRWLGRHGDKGRRRRGSRLWQFGSNCLWRHRRLFSARRRRRGRRLRHHDHQSNARRAKQRRRRWRRRHRFGGGDI